MTAVHTFPRGRSLFRKELSVPNCTDNTLVLRIVAFDNRVAGGNLQKEEDL